MFIYKISYSNEEINEICMRINKSLRRSYKLKRIDFSFNFLRSRLFRLLHGLMQPLEYLNLQDCRLDSSDVAFLNTQSMLKCLRTCKELNLSMNDFSQSHSAVFNVVAQCGQLNCLSISYCQIPFDLICQELVANIILSGGASLTSRAADNDKNSNNFTQLKYICIQPFTPPKMHEILDILHAFCSIKSLQRICFLPSLYAFPGSNDQERELAADKIILICGSILESKARMDIEFINQ